MPRYKNPDWHGGAPQRSDQQCTFIKRDGTRCRAWAKKGTNPPRCSCKRHRRRKKPEADVGVKHLPSFYKHRLTETLSSRVEVLREVSNEDQLQLYEELALMRDAATESIVVYDQSLALLSLKPEDPELKKLVEDASKDMRRALESVGDYALKAARIREMTAGKMDSHAIASVIHQMTRIAHDVCEGAHSEVAVELERRLREDIVMPLADNRGTDITPDQDVLDMDETIPKYTEGDDNAG